MKVVARAGQTSTLRQRLEMARLLYVVAQSDQGIKCKSRDVIEMSFACISTLGRSMQHNSAID